MGFEERGEDLPLQGERFDRGAEQREPVLLARVDEGAGRAHALLGRGLELARLREAGERPLVAEHRHLGGADRRGLERAERRLAHPPPPLGLGDRPLVLVEDRELEGDPEQ